MQVNDELLTKLEKLSALKISKEKRKELEQQLEQIVDFVQKLDELKLDGMEVITNTTLGGTPLREDKSYKHSVIEIVSKYAPKSQDGFFIVPKIIE
ncbi:Asp-tRNA(Asn)/Glu-tRNA(Gln) amidotransferase subunit GatC [Campylobacter sp.]|uniref:Asp-tRNA(Asn)/Glu-tRNA(Gln) amidotransferase subunit GatC n=1 Tax=Campylobacter sp. TaxID=205 RepID=UPI0025C12A6E|nr:Asp-tRNA(Asn)/Glu-tRNA(Gln) amidotransferase subunit GatC [Campylobacter sp.]